MNFLETTFEKYIEIEMLSCIAEIYGISLNNKEKALEYANKAANLNSGQLILRSAYNAAGIEYNPAFYRDKLADIAKKFDIEAKPEEEITAKIAN